MPATQSLLSLLSPPCLPCAPRAVLLCSYFSRPCKRSACFQPLSAAAAVARRCREEVRPSASAEPSARIGLTPGTYAARLGSVDTTSSACSADLGRFASGLSDCAVTLVASLQRTFLCHPIVPIVVASRMRSRRATHVKGECARAGRCARALGAYGLLVGRSSDIRAHIAEKFGIAGRHLLWALLGRGAWRLLSFAGCMSCACCFMPYAEQCKSRVRQMRPSAADSTRDRGRRCATATSSKGYWAQSRCRCGRAELYACWCRCGRGEPSRSQTRQGGLGVWRRAS